MKTTETTTFHVRYQPKNINSSEDEWWDWKKFPTWEEAIEAFKDYPPRVENSHKAHVVTTTTIITEETLMYL